MPYLPDHDAVDDVDTLLDVVDRRPLALLVTLDDGVPDADPVPLLARRIDGGVELQGHVARANPLWRRTGPALAVFTEDDHYISPSWYPSKAEHHRTVPTWNYIVVHCWGPLTVHDDKAWLRAFLAHLTTHEEAGRDDPWRMGMAPQDYLDAMITQVVGISMRVERMTGKFKVSAHKSDADRLGARDGVLRDVALTSRGTSGRALADRMTDPPGRPPS